MKTLFFILATSFLCCATSFGQMITAEIIINGDPHRNHFSRSEQNSIVVKGIGCDHFKLKGSGVTLVERSGDYYVQINTTGGEATITVSAMVKGKTMTLYTRKFPVIN
jgi:hypothetical protein